MSDKTLAEMVWANLNKELSDIKNRVSTLEARTERSETAGGVPAVLFANLPYAGSGVKYGDLMFVLNGRKSGEGAGAGTGVLCFYQESTDNWRVVSDAALAVTV